MYKFKSSLITLAGLMALIGATTFVISATVQAQDHTSAGNASQKKDQPDADREEEKDDDDEDDERGRPVVYLHYDYMVKRGRGGHSHKPDPESIRMVVQAFRQHGIKLHIDAQHAAIPESPYLGFGEHNCAESVNFYDLKAQYFHPRGNHPWHYAIFGHAADFNFVCCLYISGVSELGGYNFMVVIGQFLDFIPPDFISWLEGGVFMHELGHNLGLLHGGFENHNLKPNYISTMNYDYTFGISSAASPGSTVAVSRRLDYSDRVLPTLDENHLDEDIGVSAGNNDIVYYICLPPGNSEPDYVAGYGPGIGPIDWNCNGLIEPDVQADINLFFDDYPYDRFIRLRGFDDWTYLRSYLNSPQHENRVLLQNPEIIGCDPGRPAFR